LAAHHGVSVSGNINIKHAEKKKHGSVKRVIKAVMRSNDKYGVAM